jgi:hypothetical protein
VLGSILLTKKYAAHIPVGLSCFMSNYGPTGSRPGGKVIIQSRNSETSCHSEEPGTCLSPKPARSNHIRTQKHIPSLSFILYAARLLGAITT